MKLAALCTVAGLSLLGCADEASTGGGQGEGIKPGKISFVPPEQEKPFDPTQVVTLKQKRGSAPGDAICDGCVVTSYKVVDNSYGIDEVRLVTDGGLLICKTFLGQDGFVIVDECGWSRP